MMRRKPKGQTILEYFFMLMAFALPIGAAMRSALEDKEDGKKKNFIYELVKDSYGEKGRLGAIGRPYP